MKQNLVKLMEAELAKAETALAVKSMGDKVQDMMEDVAKLRVDSLMTVTETIKEQFGIEQGDSFFNQVDQLLGSLQDDLRNAKSEIDNQVAYLNGEERDMGSDMGDMPDMDPSGMEPDMGMADAEEDPELDAMFGADPANVGGDAPLGRMKRESIAKKMRVLEARMKRLQKSK